MKQKINNEPINQELSEILAKYYDGSFARLVQEYIRFSGITEEEKGSVGGSCEKLSIIENRTIMKKLK